MIAEEEYFRGIEDHFNQKRGNPWPLSPKELKLIDEWFETQIPMEIVVRAIDRAFEKKQASEDKEITTLLYCRRFVKSEHRKHLKSLEGKGAEPAETAGAKDVAGYLNSLADSLGKSAARAGESGGRALADFLLDRRNVLTERILVPFQEGKNSDLQRVEQQLTDLEKDLEQVLLTAVTAEQMARFKEDAMRELKMFEGKLEIAVYQEMLRRAVIKSIRKQYDIPRLSLFYM